MDRQILKKEKIAFIINPISGSDQKHTLPDLIQEIIDPLKFDTDYFFTKCAGHATELAAGLAEKKYSRVIAVGGDGTVNEIAKALVGTDSALGIIPCGSGNGLARFLKIPLKKKDAIALQNKSEIISIDYGLINDNPFFCTCGVGFDAHIGKKFASSSKRGFFVYLKEAILSFIYYKPKKYSIKVDGEKIKTRAFLVTVANAGQYGNDAFIAPRADISDGLLDLCIINPFPRYKAFHLGFRLFNKTIDQSKYATVLRGQKIKIKRKKKGEVHLDGEPAVMGKKLEIKVVNKGLKVIVAATGSSFRR